MLTEFGPNNPKLPLLTPKSAFSPLNLVEDASSKKELEEDHTREIEIENAFKTFQEAIVLHEENQLAEAYVKFKDLSRKDVILTHYYEETAFIKGLQNGGLNTQPDELSFISPKVKSIRYLYFRNRGFLYFRILKSLPETLKKVLDADAAISRPQESPTSEFDFSKELFYSMMDDLANCFVYQEADELLLQLLYDLYTYMDVRKLARYTLEYARSLSEESDEIMSLLPMNDWADKLWENFEKKGLTKASISSSLEEKLLFLRPIRDDLQQLILKKYQKNPLEIALKNSPTWLDVIQAFNSALRATMDKERVAEAAKSSFKHTDPYLLTESTLDSVNFVFAGDDDVEADVVEMDIDNEAAEEEKKALPEDVEFDAQEVNPIEERDLSSQLAAPSVSTPALSEKIIHRSSRRLKPEDAAPYEPDDIQLTRHYYVETEGFFSHLNSFFKDIFGEDSPVLKDVVAYIVDDADETTPQYIQDFVMALNDWDRKVYTPIVLAEKASQKDNIPSKTDGEKLKLMDVLTQFGNQYVSDTELVTENLDDLEVLLEIKSFLAQIAGKHVNVVKVELLYHLIGNPEKNMIIDFQWSSAIFSAVREWVLQLEAEILNLFEQRIATPRDVHEQIEFVVTIYEILIDLYVETKGEIDKYFESPSRGKSKAGLNANSLELIRLNDRITKWQCFIAQKLFCVCPVRELAQQNVTSVIRYFWASNYRLAAKSFSWKEKKYVVQDLLELIKFLESSGHNNRKFSLPNFANLGDFSEESLHRRLSTASILSIFSRILYNDEHKDLDGGDDTIQLLENILIKKDQSDVSMDDSQLDVNTLVESVINGKAALDNNSLTSVQDFLDECPIDLKLSLWNILFLYYEDISSFEKFQKGLEQYLAFALEYWGSFRYKNSKGNRVLSFLVSLNFFKSYLKVFLRYLAEHQWILPLQSSDDNTEVILNLARIFEICYVFSLHEEAALITGNKISLGYRSEAAFTAFKDFCIDSMTIMLVYCVTRINNSGKEDGEGMITRILRLVHQQLGLRRLCDASSGIFLRFSEYTLVGLKDKPSIDLAQLLSCRFHFKVKTYDIYPVDHYTTKVSTLDKGSAKELAAFVLPLCFRENPILKAPRNDMKQVLDDLMEVIGDPDIEGNSTLVHNNATLEKFIDASTLTARFIKECFYGITSIDLITPQTGSRVALDGLYFLQAVTMFNSYKIRKKSAQSRTVELERIIRLLKDDLIFGSNRMESWLLLGQAYGYIVEDDLIWTSDKLNIIDRKVVTANLQRKSLVCYIMAINTLTQQGPTENESTNAVIGVIMNSFVKEMYGAVQVPMDMIAFKVRNTYKFVRKRNQTMFQTVSDKPTVPTKFCFKLMLRCLQIAIKSNANDWSSFFYLAKVMAKLNRKPEDVIEYLLSSCKLCQAQGTTADTLLEPSYKLVTLLYKYVKANKLTVESAVSYLKREPIVNMTIENEVLDKLLFYRVVISALQKLITLDKKAWYHKPCYRMAVIEYDEFDDYKKAREVMNKFFSLKASNKTFLQMWKPENERPGKHFVYMFQYTQFFIKMLRRELDLSSLIQILPKLRKANSTMVLLYFAWENLASSICKLIRVIAQVEDNLVEVFLLKHSHSTFMAEAKFVVEKVKERGMTEYQKPLFCYLQVVNEMRKLNNGFGPTSLIDDTICAIFVKIFNGIDKPSKVLETIDLTVRFKKLAKRDLFPFANELVTRCKRDVDFFLKDDPELFNTYVARYIELKRTISMQLFKPVSLAENGQPPKNENSGENALVVSAAEGQTEPHSGIIVTGANGVGPSGVNGAQFSVGNENSGGYSHQQAENPVSVESKTSPSKSEDLAVNGEPSSIPRAKETSEEKRIADHNIVDTSFPILQSQRNVESKPLVDTAPAAFPTPAAAAFPTPAAGSESQQSPTGLEGQLLPAKEPETPHVPNWESKSPQVSTTDSRVPEAPREISDRISYLDQLAAEFPHRPSESVVISPTANDEVRSNVDKVTSPQSNAATNGTDLKPIGESKEDSIGEPVDTPATDAKVVGDVNVDRDVSVDVSVNDNDNVKSKSNSTIGAEPSSVTEATDVAKPQEDNQEELRVASPPIMVNPTLKEVKQVEIYEISDGEASTVSVDVVDTTEKMEDLTPSQFETRKRKSVAETSASKRKTRLGGK